jgi:hypothetical protein
VPITVVSWGEPKMLDLERAWERTSMPFIQAPNVLRVVDPRGNSLKKYVRDVPRDEEWFDFVFEGTQEGMR